MFHLGDYGIPYGYSPLLVASEKFLQCAPALFPAHSSLHQAQRCSAPFGAPYPHGDAPGCLQPDRAPLA